MKTEDGRRGGKTPEVRDCGAERLRAIFTRICGRIPRRKEELRGNGLAKPLRRVIK